MSDRIPQGSARRKEEEEGLGRRQAGRRGGKRHAGRRKEETQ